MLRISALNESGGSESDTDSGQVETREAQEANLLNLYTTALKFLASKDVTAAKDNLLSIIESPIFKEEKEDSLARSLRFNVHKNLGECYLQEGMLAQAQEAMLLATEMDSGDVTLWFKIAGTSVKLKNLYMCRSALEQGLRACHNHWPSIDNLITVTYKLGDYLACLGYCHMAQEIDPAYDKIVLFKSKIYNEMPFLQEAYSDTEFKPIPTEIEQYHGIKLEEPIREPIEFNVSELTFDNVAREIFRVSEYCDANDLGLHPIDTGCTMQRLEEAKKKQEELKIHVSVQNVVDEIIDIIEEEEEIIACVEEILDDMLCDMFGVEPKPVSEKVASHIVDVVVSNIFEQTGNTNKKKSVIIEPKPRERKRVNAFDEIPQELIEKRRSSRKAKFQEVAPSPGETNQDPITIQTPRELLESFLPPQLKAAKGFAKILSEKEVSSRSKCDSTNSDGKAGSVAKSLFADTKTWFTEDEEKEEVCRFLTENSGKTIWYLMKNFLDYVFRLENRMVWPEELVTFTAKVYNCWRIHLADPIDNPDDKFTREFLRYYIIGCECMIGSLQQQGVDKDSLPADVRARLHQDLEELYCILGHLPIDLQLRIHSLRFYFFSILEIEDEILYETGQLMKIYAEHPDIPIFKSLPQYKIATRKYLEEYSKEVSLSKELEELNQYYESERYEDIVKLVLGTLESNKFTPTKETSRVPDRETQIDILIESLLHTERYGKCVEWSTTALASCLQQMLAVATHDGGDEEGGKEGAAKLNAQDLEVINAYLAVINNCIENSENESFDGTRLDTLSALAAILVQLIEIQINHMTPATVLSLPWILLHKLLTWSERQQDSDAATTDKNLPGSLSLLCSAHDYLGQKSCCSSEKGMLLNYVIDTFVPIMTGKSLPQYSDQIKTNLDQAIYCLFAHPSKKSRVRHLADHGVSQIALTWDRAKLIYRYLRPQKVPEHDDVKLLSISAECENFMKRVVALIPDDVFIHKRRLAAELVVLGKKEVPKVGKFKRLPSDMNDLFYLLADYAFKNSMDMDRALDLYTLDISFNWGRYDTWAALGLAQASKMDKRLNSCKKLNPVKMLEYFESVKNCFERCIQMNSGNSNIFIEYGNFSYNFQSYISRTLNNNSENMTIDMFEKLEKTREALLKKAMENYDKTLAIFVKDGINEDDVDERWLLHYMIGKIKEKTSCTLLDTINSYLTSIQHLEDNGAIVPKKVNYNSPQTWAVEALEVYYRVHTLLLKYLVKFESNENGIDLDMKRKIYELLRKVQLNKIYATNSHTDKAVRFSRKRKAEGELDISKYAKLESSPTNIMRDVIEVMDNCIKEVEFNLDETKMSVSSLIQLCLLGLEDVAVHFFHHFKSVYRLAHYYFTSSTNKDLARVEKLLLAGEKDKNTQFPGLYFGRKPNQIFHEIWRIPISEVDRPGSFASHCAKGLVLLIDVLRILPELTTLADVAVQMKKPPNEENKFVHESDRVEIATMASTYLLNTIKSKVTNTEDNVGRVTLILDLHKVYQKLLKEKFGREKEILSSMKDLYVRIKGRPETDKVANDEVLRFCTAEAKVRSGKAPASLSMSSRSSSHNTSSATTITPASTLALDKLPKNETQILRPDTVKDFSQTAAYLQKIDGCLNMLALNMPSITLENTLAFCGINLGEQKTKLNSLFQQLCSMNKQELTNIAFNTTALVKVSTFALQVGLDPIALQHYVTKLNAILEGLPLTGMTQVPLDETSVFQQKTSASAANKFTGQANKAGSAGGKSESEAYRKKMQEILVAQSLAGPAASTTVFSANKTASNISAPTKTISSTSKAGNSNDDGKEKYQRRVSDIAISNVKANITPKVVDQKNAAIPTTIDKTFPGGVSISSANVGATASISSKQTTSAKNGQQNKLLSVKQTVKFKPDKEKQKNVFPALSKGVSITNISNADNLKYLGSGPSAVSLGNNKKQDGKGKGGLPPNSSNLTSAQVTKAKNTGPSMNANKQLKINSGVTISSGSGSYSLLTSKAAATKATPGSTNKIQSKGNKTAVATPDRIFTLPAGLTLTHISSQFGGGGGEKSQAGGSGGKADLARASSPALARVGTNSNPGSRSNSPKITGVGKAQSPAQQAANRAAATVDKNNKPAGKQAPNVTVNAKDQLASFKAQMKKSLQIKETGNKKNNGGGGSGANLPGALAGKANGGKNATNAGNATITNPATNKAGAAAGSKGTVVTSLAAPSNIFNGGKTSIAGSLAAMKATAVAASKGQSQGKPTTNNKAKSSEPEIICIDID